MAEKINVGLDLGATNCTIGTYDNAGTPHWEGPIPSVGAYNNGSVSWGHEARRILLSDAGTHTPIRDLKIALTQKEYQVGVDTVTSYELLVSLISYLVSQLALDTSRLGTAVIGTPVNLDSPLEHRRIVEKAALAVGFEDVRFVYEPTAALIGAEENLGSITGKHLILVIDWGGSTLDLVVIRKEWDVYRELAVKANFGELGGTYIDDRLTRRLLNENPKVKSKVNIDGGLYELLKETVEYHKELILGDPLREDDDAELIAPAWLRARMEMSPALVNEVIREFVDRAVEEIGQMLDRATIRPSDITHLLFAGGVCKSDIVQNAIRKTFPEAAIYRDRPQLETGIGCTTMTRFEYAVELAADFGVRQCDDSFCCLLPKGYELSTDRYRRAVFLVTDVLADEALFDFGIRNSNDSVYGGISSSSALFQSMKQLWVVVKRPSLSNGHCQSDQVTVHAGVDRFLTVAVYAQSNLGNDRKKSSISELPLAIKLGRNRDV